MVQLDERELTRVMGEAVGGAKPSTQRLVEGALRQGGRFKARRRAAYSTAACVLAGVVAGTSWLGTQQAPAEREMRILPGMSAGGPGQVTFPDFAVPQSSDGPPPGKEQMTGRALASALRTLAPLPQTSWSHRGFVGEAPTNPSYAAAGMRVGADGVEGVNFTLGAVLEVAYPGLERSYSCKALEDPSQTVFGNGGKVTSCGVRNLADGSVLMLFEVEYGHGVSPNAKLLRSDGVSVEVGVWPEPDASQTAPELPLTLQELEQIVTSNQLQVYVDPEVNDRAKDLSPFEEVPNAERVRPEGD